ncbi:MAG: nuclear transport factor 2 family protein [Caulobacteraceae bacterium]
MAVSRMLAGAAIGAVATAVIAAVGFSQIGQAADRDTEAGLRARVAVLETRMQRAEDIHAIEKLTRAYGYYLEKKQWTEIVDLWSENGSVEISARGFYKGKKSVSHFFIKVMGGGANGLKQGQLFEHMILQGIVDVDPDGKHAKGRWRALQQVATLGKSAVLAEGPYENTYVKENGVWKFESMHYYDTYHTDYSTGWVKGGQEMHGPNKDIPPDAPMTEVYDSYPGYHVPAYHYANPGSGRKWTAADTKKYSSNGIAAKGAADAVTNPGR